MKEEIHEKIRDMWSGKGQLTSFASRRRSCIKAIVLLASHIRSKAAEIVKMRWVLRIPMARKSVRREMPLMFRR
jgi:hypothetical protein